MTRLFGMLFWIADRRHRAWKQLELFASERKMVAVQDMHLWWKKFTGKDLKE